MLEKLLSPTLKRFGDVFLTVIKAEVVMNDILELGSNSLTPDSYWTMEGRRKSYSHCQQ